jgi:hypothetical protein
MDISRDQAADALKDIEAVAARSHELKSYAVGAPILIMWGLISVVGYGASALSPAYSIGWFPLSIMGMAGTVWLARRAKNQAPEFNRIGARIGWTWSTLLVFAFAAYAVLRPHEANQFAAFPALLVALSYTIMGIWSWRRYAVLGIGVASLTLLGYFLLAPYYALWMAAVVGGGLIVGGLWLRKA